MGGKERASNRKTRPEKGPLRGGGGRGGPHVQGQKGNKHACRKYYRKKRKRGKQIPEMGRQMGRKVGMLFFWPGKNAGQPWGVENGRAAEEDTRLEASAGKENLPLGKR